LRKSYLSKCSNSPEVEITKPAKGPVLTDLGYSLIFLADYGYFFVFYSANILLYYIVKGLGGITFSNFYYYSSLFFDAAVKLSCIVLLIRSC